MIHDFVHLSDSDLTALTTRINEVVNRKKSKYKNWQRDGSIQVSVLSDGSILFHQMLVYSHLSAEEVIISLYEID